MIAREQVEAVLAECTDSTVIRRRVADALLALIAAQPVQQPSAVVEQKPVAHALMLSDTVARIWFGDQESADRWSSANGLDPQALTPLYTAPVPAAGVQGDAMCPVCKGSGEQRGPHGFPCVTCDGTGEVLDLPAVKSSDISHCLREYARNSGYSHNDYADAMRIAADEIDRLTAVQQQPDSGRDAALVALLREAVEVINSVPSTYGIDLVSRINAALAAHPANGAQVGLSDEQRRDIELAAATCETFAIGTCGATLRAILAAAKKGT